MCLQQWRGLHQPQKSPLFQAASNNAMNNYVMLTHTLDEEIIVIKKQYMRA